MKRRDLISKIEKNEKIFEIQYSGFLLVDYFEVYLNLFTKYFQSVDDYFSTISPENADAFSKYLKENPIEEEKVSAFLKEDQDMPVNEQKQTIEAYSRVHNDMIECLSLMSSGRFGVLHLSF